MGSCIKHIQKLENTITEQNANFKLQPGSEVSNTFTKEERSSAGANSLGICKTKAQLISKTVLSTDESAKNELPTGTKTAEIMHP